MAIVKKPFVVLTDDCRRFEFDAGEQHIPAEIADHWYVKAHVEPEPQAQVYDAPEAASISDEPEAPEIPEARKTLKAKK